MKPKHVVVLVALVAVVFWIRSSREEAPLVDGSFLEYESGGATVRVTFSDSGGDMFGTRLELGYEDEEPIQATGSRETVDRRLRTDDGRIFEVGTLGPLWIPPGEARVGGSAHGTRIDEVRSWEPWEIAVVTASVGVGGALRGEWYYDTTTGFLVGGATSTAVSLPGEGQVFRLVDGNISHLAIP